MSAPTSLIFLYPSSGPPYTVCPYIDTTGWLLQIPTVLTAANGGGYAVPSAVSTPPTFVLNGVTLSGGTLPTLLYFNINIRPSCTRSRPSHAGDVLTMSAAQGWATACGGQLGGTSSGEPVRHR